MARAINPIAPFKRLGALALATAAIGLMFGGVCNAATRVGQLADIEAPLPNQLLGFGLVMGLNGTGDTGDTCALTFQDRQALARLGVQTHYKPVSSKKDIAAVWITANAHQLNQGQSIDVVLSSACNAANITGGRLVPTALIDAAGRVEAVARGSVDPIDAKVLETPPSSKTLSDETIKSAHGRIAGGGLVEQATTGVISARLYLTLHHPDLATATCMAAAINATHTGTASAQSAELVTVDPPASAPLDAFVDELKQIDLTSSGGCAKTPAAQTS